MTSRVININVHVQSPQSSCKFEPSGRKMCHPEKKKKKIKAGKSFGGKTGSEDESGEQGLFLRAKLERVEEGDVAGRMRFRAGGVVMRRGTLEEMNRS